MIPETIIKLWCLKIVVISIIIAMVTMFVIVLVNIFAIVVRDRDGDHVCDS